MLDFRANAVNFTSFTGKQKASMSASDLVFTCHKAIFDICGGWPVFSIFL